MKTSPQNGTPDAQNNMSDHKKTNRDPLGTGLGGTGAPPPVPEHSTALVARGGALPFCRPREGSSPSCYPAAVGKSEWGGGVSADGQAILSRCPIDSARPRQVAAGGGHPLKGHQDLEAANRQLYTRDDTVRTSAVAPHSDTGSGAVRGRPRRARGRRGQGQHSQKLA